LSQPGELSLSWFFFAESTSCFVIGASSSHKVGPIDVGNLLSLSDFLSIIFLQYGSNFSNEGFSVWFVSHSSSKIFLIAAPLFFLYNFWISANCLLLLFEFSLWCFCCTGGILLIFSFLGGNHLARSLSISYIFSSLLQLDNKFHFLTNSSSGDWLFSQKRILPLVPLEFSCGALFWFDCSVLKFDSSVSLDSPVWVALNSSRICLYNGFFVRRLLSASTDLWGKLLCSSLTIDLHPTDISSISVFATKYNSSGSHLALVLVMTCRS